MFQEGDPVHGGQSKYIYIHHVRTPESRDSIRDNILLLCLISLVGLFVPFSLTYHIGKRDIEALSAGSMLSDLPLACLSQCLRSHKA